MSPNIAAQTAKRTEESTARVECQVCGNCTSRTTAMENDKQLPVLVDCDYSLVKSRCLKADIEIANH